MITFTLVIILGVFLVIVLMQLSKKPVAPAAKQQAPLPDIANLKVTDARPGDVISVAGAGDNMTDLDFTADRVTRVEAGTRQWIEIAGPYRERRVVLRAGGDEELETALHADARKITLDDLGLAENDLAEIDERQNTSDNFEFDGKTWLYHLSREARAWRDGQQPAGFYYWEFQEQGGKGLLAIRKAEGEPFTVTQFAGVAPGDITIYRGQM